MNHHIKKILLVASILALLVSARDTQSRDAVDPAGGLEAGPPPGAQVEPSPTPTSTPEGDAGGPDQVINAESFQVAQTPAGSEEPVSTVDPENIPSPEELNAILDRVNLGGPVLSESSQAASEGPAPGTESRMGPVNDSSSADPESIPSEEERDAILDRVNRGGPELPGSDEAVGEGPAPGTESDTEQGFSPGWILIQIIQTLRNCWHEFLS